MKRFSVTVTDDEKEILEDYAYDNELSLSQVIRQAVKLFIKKVIYEEE